MPYKGISLPRVLGRRKYTTYGWQLMAEERKKAQRVWLSQIEDLSFIIQLLHSLHRTVKEAAEDIRLRVGRWSDRRILRRSDFLIQEGTYSRQCERFSGPQSFSWAAGTWVVSKPICWGVL